MSCLSPSVRISGSRLRTGAFRRCERARSVKSRQTRFSPVAGTSPPAKARFHPEAQGEYLEVIAYLGLQAPSAVE